MLQLTCAREVTSHEDMATAHACLAVTNGDLGRYETALFHYQKEAELRSDTGAYNPEEVRKLCKAFFSSQLAVLVEREER